jgi:hypothetical protein
MPRGGLQSAPQKKCYTSSLMKIRAWREMGLTLHPARPGMKRGPYVRKSRFAGLLDR